MPQASQLRPWVTQVRLRVSPYGRVLTVIFVLVLLLLGLNALLSWGLLGLSAKKSQGFYPDSGSTPILRTLSLRLILSQRGVHVEAQALQS